MNRQTRVFVGSLCLVILTGCGFEKEKRGLGSSDRSDTPADHETEPSPSETGAPQELIANAYSGTSIGLSWLDAGTRYKVYRNDIELVETSDNHYVDENLTVNTQYRYAVTTGDVQKSEQTSEVSAKTLINANNSAQDNGAETVINNDRLMNFEPCNVNTNNASSEDVAEADLDACLEAMLEHNGFAQHLENMRAFAARLRSEQSQNMIELGMRLFHSKSLSSEQDTACASCHHPALGCGGDDLSMPVGVNSVNENLLGEGRSDNSNAIPIVARNSPATCNTGLWTRGLFWDNRVAITAAGLSSSSDDVNNNTEAAVGTGSLALLMAQAHFPVTSAAEMGDITQFGYDNNVDSDVTAYRETVLAQGLSDQKWGSLFKAAFGDSSINYSRIAQAIAAYEAVQIFIDNPFFDYVDGNTNAISNNAKRGAITFMDSRSGCTFCHTGSFFTTQAPLPVNYPQIGVGTQAGGADLGEGSGSFRSTTLLNVALTGPWGHAGQFGTLKRNIEHYSDHGASVAAYFANEEMCDLKQFKHLNDCAQTLAPDGLELSEAIIAGNPDFSNNLNESEVDLIVLFLETLTDPDAANVSSNAIQALIPSRDGGPDSKQLDGVDRHGNAL